MQSSGLGTLDWRAFALGEDLNFKFRCMSIAD